MPRQPGNSGRRDRARSRPSPTRMPTAACVMLLAMLHEINVRVGGRPDHRDRRSSRAERRIVRTRPRRGASRPSPRLTPCGASCANKFVGDFATCVSFTKRHRSEIESNGSFRGIVSRCYNCGPWDEIIGHVGLRSVLQLQSASAQADSSHSQALPAAAHRASPRSHRVDCSTLGRTGRRRERRLRARTPLGARRVADGDGTRQLR